MSTEKAISPEEVVLPALDITDEEREKARDVWMESHRPSLLDDAFEWQSQLLCRERQLREEMAKRMTIQNALKEIASISNVELIGGKLRTKIIADAALSATGKEPHAQ